jgi:hypothetical protein
MIGAVSNIYLAKTKRRTEIKQHWKGNLKTVAGGSCDVTPMMSARKAIISVVVK